MSSKHIGKNEEEIEVTSLTKEGIILRIEGKNYSLLYENFPWLRYVTAVELSNIELRDDDIVIPDLDIELELESLIHPEKYTVLDKTLRELQNKSRSSVHDYDKEELLERIKTIKTKSETLWLQVGHYFENDTKQAVKNIDRKVRPIYFFEPIVNEAKKKKGEQQHNS